MQAAGRLLAVAQSRVKNLNRSTHGFLSSPSGNVCRTGTKKAPSLNSALRDEAKLRGTTLVAAEKTATTLSASINAQSV